jgi:amino acid adenylation domain-containing protein
MQAYDDNGPASEKSAQLSIRETMTTEAQREIWISSQMGMEASCAYNESFTVGLHGPVDLDALTAALGKVIAGHDALGSTFSADGLTMRRILPGAPAAVIRHNWQSASPEESRAFLDALLAREALAPFDLEKGPVCRAYVVTRTDCTCDVVFTAHHIVCDGWSINVLVREIGRTYDALTSGNIPDAMPYASFYDFVRDVGTLVTAQRRRTVIDYWKNRLAPPIPVLDLPNEGNRPSLRTYGARSLRKMVGKQTIDRIKKTAAAGGCNAFAYLLGAYAVFLNRLTGSEDVIIGVPVAGQSFYDNPDIVGHCVNMLPVRLVVAPDAGFIDLAGAVQDALLDAFEHHECTYGDLVRELKIPRDPAHAPLISTGMTYAKRLPAGEMGFTGLETSYCINPRSFETFEVYAALIDGDDGLELLWHFNKDLVSEATAARWIEEYETLVAAVAENPRQKVHELPMLTKAERGSMLGEWNATDGPFTIDETAIDMFEEQVRRVPDAIAVEFNGISLTYGELNGAAEKVAAALLRLGAGPDVPVAFCLDRCPDMVASLLGVLKSGAAYVPIDPSLPDDRISFIINDSGAKALITTSTMEKRFLAMNVPTVLVDRISGGSTVCQPSEKADGRHCAYLIYTSGSTGKPKGVEIRHFSLANFLRSMRREPGISAADSLLAITTISFDIAGLEILLPLTTGAKVFLAEKELAVDGVRLVEFLRAKQPSIMQATPATWNMLLDGGWQDAKGMKVLCGGEAMTRRLADRLLSTGAEVWNMYGPTETTIWSSLWKVAPGEKQPPIGRPIDNTKLYVLGPGLSLSPLGAAGELYIGGIGLARGYRNRPELTSERFIDSPFPQGLFADVEKRIYKTGDVARRLPDGTIEVLGRGDFQVKIRGFRIELGEIEAALTGLPNVKECVVVDGPDSSGNKILIAYVVFLDNEKTSIDDVRVSLRRTLPDYMVPSIFMPLPALPRLINGKIDRKSLPQQSGLRPVLSTERVAPRTDAERMVAGLWDEVLGTKGIGVRDNFFEVGGHSLLATQVCLRVRKAFGVDLALQDFFAMPTIEQLADRLDSATVGGKARDEGPPILRIERGNRLPLSAAQQRLWFLHQMDPASPAYNIIHAFRITGPLEVSALQRAFDGLVKRHEILRTVFSVVDGVPYVAIGPAVSVALQTVVHEPGGTWHTLETVSQFTSVEAPKPFDIERGPLMRIFLFSLAPSEHVCTVVIHHLITDGWSMGVMMNDVGTLYACEKAGAPSTLEQLPVQYVDFAQWQRRCLASPEMAVQMDYWRVKLGGELPLLQLPLDFNRPMTLSHHGSEVVFSVPREVVVGLARLNQQQGVTMFMTLLSGFAVLLNRYTGQEDLVVGSPIANRRQVELEDLIGLFANTLAWRMNVDQSQTFIDLLRQVRETSLEAYRHQDVQFEELVRTLNLPRDVGHNPVFQTMFAFQNYPMLPVETGGLSLSPVWVGRGATQFDLAFFLEENDGGIEGVIEYSTELFNRSTIERFASQFVKLLAAIAQRPAATIHEYSILTEEEERKILETWNSTTGTFPENLCINDLIVNQAKKTPDAIAVESEGRAMSYRQLDERSNQLANLLRSKGAAAETLVGVLLDRSVDIAVAELAVLKAGAAYVPLDPNYPSERLSFMLEDASIGIVITQSSLSAVLPGKAGHVVFLDVIGDQPMALDNSPLHRMSGPDNAAYVIFTSGSTGKPKGVVIRHRSLVNFAVSMAREPGMSANDAVLAITTISFDIAVLELLAPLTVGARCVIASREAAGDGRQLAALIDSSKITLMQGTPSTWRLLIAGGWAGTPGLKALCGGEAFPRDLLKELLSKAGSVWNMYGPTETTVWSTCCRLTDATALIGIGKPIANTRVYVLDKYKHPAPVGVPGELYIGGLGVARGYLNRPDLTGQRFGDDPFGSFPPSRMYATGDLARWRDDGTLECLGRIDTQVKVRGYRIELGEIESVAKRHPLVIDAVAVIATASVGDVRLAIYFVAKKESPLSTADLRDHLRRSLPEYMIPQHFMKIDAVPLTPAGKVDRKHLPSPIGAGESAKGFIAPRSDIESMLAQIWHDVLGTKQVSINDNFFEVGGHSLLAVRLFSKIEQATGLNLPLATLFSSPTIEALAVTINELMSIKRAPSQKDLSLDLDHGKKNWTYIVPIKPDGNRPPFFCVHGVGGNVLNYNVFTPFFDPDQPFYGIQCKGIDGFSTPFGDVRSMATAYVAELRQVRPRGPYFLGGGSMGGLVAFEMAQQLMKIGESVPLLVMFDSLYPRLIEDIVPINLKGQKRPDGFIKQLIWEWGELKERVDNSIKVSQRAFFKLRGIPVPHDLRYWYIERRNLAIAKLYFAEPYTGLITMFRATLNLACSDPYRGWKDVAVGGMRFFDFACDHDHMVELEALARKLNEVLSESASKS